jgi:2-alkenal reductase
MKKTFKNLKSGWLVVLPLFLMACSIFSLPVLTSKEAISPSATSAPIQPTPTPIAIPADLSDEQDVLVNLYARANSAVVNLTIYSQQNGQLIPQGQGSGFVYDAQGSIITNAHVVRQADQVDVTFSDGTIRPAQVIGQDLHSDLAVVRVDELPEGVGALPLGEMDNLAVGQTVVAIGNPFGLEGTLTKGIISALGRTIPALTVFSIPQAIQTDAAINPGNSGGPLLDLEGRVIGVNAQIETNGTSSTNSGVGFAIPVSVVERVIPVLIEKGVYDWSWLGVRGGNLTPTLAEAMDLSQDQGAYLIDVMPDGPANKAGLRGANKEAMVEGRQFLLGGDVITAIDDQLVRSFDDLLIYIALQTEPGQEVTLSILRGNKTQTISLHLEARPKSLVQEGQSPSGRP